MNILLLMFSAIQSYLLWQLWQTSDSHAHRINRLEHGKANPAPKAPERPQTRQIWDKEIEGFNLTKVETMRPKSGRLDFDNDAQIAEWI